MKTEYASVEEWRAEAERLFGDDPLKWKFECPSCGHVASVDDWRLAGAKESHAAFSCVGRFLPKATTFGKRPGPCDYAGGGLLRINPVSIGGREARFFQFAQVSP